MLKHLRIKVVALRAVAIFSLVGCSKDEIPRATPQTVQAMQAAQSTLTDQPTEAEALAAWQDFVGKVERGELIDPLGQYVSNQTQIPNGSSSIRPKYKAQGSRMLVRNAAGVFEIVSLVPAPSSGRNRAADETTSYAADGGVDTNGTDPVDDPPMDCPPGGCVGVPVPPLPPTFITSVGRGGSGTIRDLKIISNRTVGEGLTAPGNYIKLNLNLNQGAGGINIYLCYTRDAASVLNGYEYNQNEPYSAPTDLLRLFEVKEGSAFGSIPTANDHFFPIWETNQYPNYNWARVELNEGAGGDYLWGYQSKDPGVLGLGSFTQAITEIGIIAGSNDRIQPPAGQGWTRYGRDLNDGAGGDYIYFCYR